MATYGVGQAGIIGSHLRIIATKTGRNTNQVLENKQPIRMLDKQLTDGDKCALLCISELRTMTMPNWEEDESMTFMNYLCTN